MAEKLKSKRKLKLEDLIEEVFLNGTKLIYPAFPAYLKKGERVEFDLIRDKWYWRTKTLKKGPFKSLEEAKDDRTQAAVSRLEAERKGLPNKSS
jgi:hypothetical protein